MKLDSYIGCENLRLKHVHVREIVTNVANMEVVNSVDLHYILVLLCLQYLAERRTVL